MGRGSLQDPLGPYLIAHLQVVVYQLQVGPPLPGSGAMTPKGKASPHFHRVVATAAAAASAGSAATSRRKAPLADGTANRLDWRGQID